MTDYAIVFTAHRNVIVRGASSEVEALEFAENAIYNSLDSDWCVDDEDIESMDDLAPDEIAATESVSEILIKEVTP